MTTKELENEEKKAAEEIDKQAKDEKSKLDALGSDISTVKDLLKSHVEKEEEKKKEPEKDEVKIDFSEITPKDLAKSLVDGEHKDKAKEFINQLIEDCNILPQDIHFDGKPYIDEKLMKSMEEAEEGGLSFMKAILYSMQESNERNAKKDEFQMNLLVGLSKSLIGMHDKMVEMEKSISGKGKETTDKKEEKEDELELPDLENAATDPLSKDQGMAKSTTVIDERPAWYAALRKALPGSYGNQEELEKQAKYADWIKRYGVHEASLMIPAEDLSMIRGHLPN